MDLIGSFANRVRIATEVVNSVTSCRMIAPATCVVIHFTTVSCNSSPFLANRNLAIAMTKVYASL